MLKFFVVIFLSASPVFAGDFIDYLVNSTVEAGVSEQKPAQSFWSQNLDSINRPAGNLSQAITLQHTEGDIAKFFDLSQSASPSVFERVASVEFGEISELSDKVKSQIKARADALRALRDMAKLGHSEDLKKFKAVKDQVTEMHALNLENMRVSNAHRLLLAIEKLRSDLKAKGKTLSVTKEEMDIRAALLRDEEELTKKAKNIRNFKFFLWERPNKVAFKLEYWGTPISRAAHRAIEFSEEYSAGRFEIIKKMGLSGLRNPIFLTGLTVASAAMTAGQAIGAEPSNSVSQGSARTATKFNDQDFGQK